MIAALLFDPDLRMTRAEIASACSGVGEAGNDDLAFLFAEVADSLINRVGIDDSTSSAVNAQHNTADFFVFASLSQPTYDLESRLARQLGGATSGLQKQHHTRQSRQSSRAGIQRQHP